jgi:hypothetical protein
LCLMGYTKNKNAISDYFGHGQESSIY